MKHILAILVLSGCCLLGGCSTTTLSVAPGTVANPQPDGSIEIVSEQRNRVVVRLLARRFSRKLDELPAFAIAVTNRGAEPLPFGPGNVTASSGGRPVRVYNVYQYQQAVLKEAAFGRFIADAHETAALRSTIAARAGIGGGTKPQISVRVNGADERAGIRAAEARRLGALSEVLQFASVAPGATFGGIVRLHAEDLRSGEPLQLVVAIAGEVHAFNFDVGP